MKLIRKYLYLFICTIVLIGIVIYGFEQSDTAIPLSFVIENVHDSREIEAFDAQDGNCYVFLPTYVDMEQVSVRISSNQEVSLGNALLADGSSCSDYLLETAYPLHVGGRCVSTLWFYRSANVATMYIDTATGNMTRIHEDKTYRENASVTLYDPNGAIDFASMQVTIKGRGNSSWMYEKKPYILELAESDSLLGMPSAFRWVLLANALDETNLRNKLSLDLARQVCTQWTPETAYVDVYLNGEYAGLYLLSEKLEAENKNIGIDVSQGDFLCKIEHAERQSTLKEPFLTQTGRLVEICAPEQMTLEERNRTIALVEQLEETILFSSDLESNEAFDLDSFVRRYLIDEVTANFDADTNSNYFNYKDGVFYAGPFWDYDLTFGIRKDLVSETFLAYASVEAQEKAPYNRALYQNRDFYNHMTAVYQNDFLPAMEEMVRSGICEAGVMIEAASRMNSLRWRHMFDSVQGWNSTVGQTAEELRAYFAKRVDFLNSAWIDGVQYHTVCFQTDPDTFRTVAVESGSTMTADQADFENVQWFYGETGEPFDSAQPVTEDLHLVTLYDDGTELRSLIVIAGIMVLLCLLAAMLWVDTRHRSNERSLADESARV